MDFVEFSSLLFKSFEQNKLDTPNQTQAKQFFVFCNHLTEVNAHTNLTAIRDLPSIIAKHLADSCLAADAIPVGSRLLDIGCGAGFPSIPLAIYRPDLHITALDSTDKKVRFVQECGNLLGIDNLLAVTGRAEDRELIASLGAFDAVTSRAVSRLCVLVELSIPYLRIGGKMIALKGADGEIEQNEAKRAIHALRARHLQTQNLTLTLLDGSSEQRCIIELEKQAGTPPQYPRPYATIKKSPLV